MESNDEDGDVDTMESHGEDGDLDTVESHGDLDTVESHGDDRDVDTVESHGEDGDVVSVKSHGEDGNVDTMESHRDREGVDVNNKKSHGEDGGVVTIEARGEDYVTSEDVEDVEVLYEGANPKRKEPDVLDIASDSDDEVGEDIVTVSDDTLNSNVEENKDKGETAKQENREAKKSVDMVIHFFKKATDYEDQEDTDIETLTPSQEKMEHVQEGTSKRSVVNDGVAAGYNVSKYFNKKRKVVKIPIENNSDFCEIVEDARSTDKYRNIGRYYSNFYDESPEKREKKEVPTCIDLEPTSPNAKGPTNDIPETNSVKPNSIESSSTAEETLGDTAQKADTNDDENPHGYLSEPAMQELVLLDEFRQWEKTGLGNSLKSGVKRLESGDVSMTILSYCVLSQLLLESRPQLARGKSKTWLDWEYRWRGIKREVMTLDPDIVCLQEVQFKKPNRFQNYYLPFFQRHGFGSVFKYKTGDNVDGCAIFYKTDKFSLEKEAGVDLFRANVGVLGKINVGLVCRLAPLTGARGSRTRLVVATTQLHHNQARTDIRLAQTCLILAELDRQSVRNNGLYHPTVLTGNLNLLPFSTVYQFISDGKLTYEGLMFGQRTMLRELLPPDVGLTDDCRWQEVVDERGESGVKSPGRLSHKFGLKSVYKHSRVKEAARPRTDKHPGEKEVTAFVEGDLPHLDKLVTVDYMFYNTVPSYYDRAGQDYRVEGALKLVARLSLPTQEEMISLGGMPSRICPSDHLPLAADFILKTT